MCCEWLPSADQPERHWRPRDANEVDPRDLPDRLLRAGSRRDRPNAGRGRRRQGRAPGRAVADRRYPRAGWLLRDDGRVPADHRGSAVDRRSARSAVAPEARRPGVDPHGQRGDPRDHRSEHHLGRCGGGDHRRARPARRSSRLRRPIQRDGGGLADSLLCRPAGHVSEHRRPGGGPPARRPLLGVAVHGTGCDLPPAERLRPTKGAHGRRRAADDLPGRGRHSVHSRPCHVKPEGGHCGGRLRPRCGPGLRAGERGRLQSRAPARSSTKRSPPSSWPSTPRRQAGRSNRRSSRRDSSSRR